MGVANSCGMPNSHYLCLAPFLRVNEQVGDANYEFRLGDIGASGTHWYHPHSHGATHNQVASAAYYP